MRRTHLVKHTHRIRAHDDHKPRLPLVLGLLQDLGARISANASLRPWHRRRSAEIGIGAVVGGVRLGGLTVTSWPVCDSVMAAERPARPAPTMRMLREMPVLGMAVGREVILADR